MNPIRNQTKKQIEIISDNQELISNGVKLLVITQKIDKEDDVFGFFCGWLKKLAERADNILAVCLQEGQHSLPPNIKVYSLGKEKGKSRLARLFRFYNYIWLQRQNYDVVFVHMNPIYVLLAGLFWKIWGKRVYLWYNHQHKDIGNYLAIQIVDKVFYTSPFSFASRFSKARKMPVGIDTELFTRQTAVPKIKKSILYLGRVSPIKKIEILIEAAKLLDKQGIDFILHIVGAPDKEDKRYFQKIKEIAKPLEARGKITFLDKTPNYKTPFIYNQHELFVNLTQSGSFDKTILEAMACGCLVLASNKSLSRVLPDFLLFEENNPKDLAGKIFDLFNMARETKEKVAQKLSQYVIKEHKLDFLIDKLVNAFQT